LARWTNITKAITAANTSAVTTKVSVFSAFTTIKTATKFFFAIYIVYLITI